MIPEGKSSWWWEKHNMLVGAGRWLITFLSAYRKQRANRKSGKAIKAQSLPTMARFLQQGSIFCQSYLSLPFSTGVTGMGGGDQTQSSQLHNYHFTTEPSSQP